MDRAAAVARCFRADRADRPRARRCSPWPRSRARSGDRQGDPDDHAAVVAAIAHVDAPAVELGDEPRDVEPQAEVRCGRPSPSSRRRRSPAPQRRRRRRLTGAAAGGFGRSAGVRIRPHRHHRVEQPPDHRRRQRRPLIGHHEDRVVALAREPQFDRSAGGELDGVGNELVEHLRDQVRRAVDGDGLRRQRKVERRARIRLPVAVDAAGDDGGEIEALAFDVGQRVLEPGGLAHPREDRGQPGDAALRALDVDAGVGRQRLGIEVVERAPDHGDRRAQFVRQPRRHLLLVTGVLGQSLEHGGEAARQVADLVPGARARAAGRRRGPADRSPRSASSRSRRMRVASREANHVSASVPTSSTASTMSNSRSNARLRSATTRLVVSSTTTAPRTWSPTQTGCAADTMTARVVDIYPRHGGDITWDMLRNEHPEPIETVTVTTGNKGSHLYFQYPPNGCVIKCGTDVLGAGIDIKSNGGLIIIPPSVTNRPYIFELNPSETPVAPAPDWIVQLVQEQSNEERTGHQAHPEEETEAGAFLLEDAHRALNALKKERADNYQQWLEVGMSLFSLGQAGLIAGYMVKTV